MDTTTSNYQGSKQQNYYLNHKNEINEKRRAKAAADKIASDALKLQQQQGKMEISPRLATFTKFIYFDIMVENRFINHFEIVKYLNTIPKDEYNLGNVTYLKLLIDYLAFTYKVINQNHHPWLMITNTFNIKLNKCIKDAKKSYGIK